ncbi:hypothetical protein NXC24_PB00372 (plasmid) [Rhizobium sp. NXC24]|nr:hypothetical protein NXC24_PB00372 [Rhizobium sp. NXC24]
MTLLHWKPNQGMSGLGTERVAASSASLCRPAARPSWRLQAGRARLRRDGVEVATLPNSATRHWWRRTVFSVPISATTDVMAPYGASASMAALRLLGRMSVQRVSI